MIDFIYFAIFYILCCFIAIWRLIKGPTAPDRVVAGDCVDVMTDMPWCWWRSIPGAASTSTSP